MRVSKTFKAIAAPLLYEKLEWKHMERNALGLIKKGNIIKEGISNIISKDTELEHVRSVELKRHPTHTCPLEDAGTRQRVLEVSILRIIMSGQMGKPACLENRNCPLSRGLAPEKLVVVTNTKYDYSPIRLDRFNEGRLVDLVVHITYSRRQHYPQIEYKSKAKRLFVILSHLDNTPGFIGLGMEYWALDVMSHTAHMLARSCRSHQSPREVIMVNFGILELSDTMTANRKGSVEAMCRNSIDRYIPNTISAPRGQTWRTAAEANAAVKFISMKEYLQEYDWDGVYTPEEVDDLLQGDDGDEE